MAPGADLVLDEFDVTPHEERGFCGFLATHRWFTYNDMPARVFLTYDAPEGLREHFRRSFSGLFFSMPPDQEVSDDILRIAHPYMKRRKTPSS